MCVCVCVCVTVLPVAAGPSTMLSDCWKPSLFIVSPMQQCLSATLSRSVRTSLLVNNVCAFMLAGKKNLQKKLQKMVAACWIGNKLKQSGITVHSL